MNTLYSHVCKMLRYNHVYKILIQACKNNDIDTARIVLALDNKCVNYIDIPPHKNIVHDTTKERPNMLMMVIKSDLIYPHTQQTSIEYHNDKFELIKLLVENGINVNYKCSKSNHTALSLAVKYCMYKTVKYLVQHGANVNELCGKYNRPILFKLIGISPDSNHERDTIIELVKYIIDTVGFKPQQPNGIDANAVHGDINYGIALMDYVCDIEILDRFIREGGMDIKYRARDGDTALHWLVANNSVYNNALIKYLVDAGIDPHVPNDTGFVPARYIDSVSCSVGA